LKKSKNRTLYNLQQNVKIVDRNCEEGSFGTDMNSTVKHNGLKNNIYSFDSTFTLHWTKPFPIYPGLTYFPFLG